MSDEKRARDILNDAKDSLTNAVNTVDYAHHEIHGGSHFTISDYETLGDGATADFVIVTPDTTKQAHLLIEAGGSGLVKIDEYEGVTEDGDGTTITPKNNNRNSSNTSTIVVRKGATVTGLGTRLGGAQAGAGGNVNQQRPGSGGRESEFVLKQNTKYLFRITSGAASNNISYSLDWYEHTNPE